MLKCPSLLRYTLHSLQKLSISAAQHSGSKIHQTCLAANVRNVNTTATLPLTTVRYGSTFTDMSLSQLWDGSTGLSNAGKKKGRGKRGASKRRVNIHFGKGFGYAKNKNYKYPGLNTRLVTGENKAVRLSVTEKTEGEEERLLESRTAKQKFVRVKKFPLERGWSGAKLGGMSAGKPDTYQEYEFEGFDSRILEFKLVSHMTGNLGRKHSHSALVVVGNGQGLVGYAVAKSSLGYASVRKAKNVAAQRLQFINMKDNRTIWHEFYSQIGQTKIFAAPKPEGHGLVCHRALKTISQCIGIRDLYVKTEGSTKNIQNLTEAFITGLLKMETHQDLADKTGYHVVELSENYKVPTVLSSPKDGVVNDTPLENFNMERHYMDGKTILRKPEKPKFYEKYASYKVRKLKVYTKMRNQAQLHMQRRAAALD